MKLKFLFFIFLFFVLVNQVFAQDCDGLSENSCRNVMCPLCNWCMSGGGFCTEAGLCTINCPDYPSGQSICLDDGENPAGGVCVPEFSGFGAVIAILSAVFISFFVAKKNFK